MRGQTYLIGLMALGVTWRLAAQHVGIGTNAPAARLHVQTPSTDNFTRTGWFQNQHDAANNNGVLIDIARAATDAYALDVRSGVGAGLTSRLYVRGDGNVGIGTTAPSARLHVQTPSTADVTLTGWFQNQRDALNNNGVLIDIARAAIDAYALNVQSGSTSRLYVRGDGNVGIGTTTPEARLHVNGRAIRS